MGEKMTPNWTAKTGTQTGTAQKSCQLATEGYSTSPEKAQLAHRHAPYIVGIVPLLRGSAGLYQNRHTQLARASSKRASRCESRKPRTSDSQVESKSSRSHFDSPENSKNSPPATQAASKFKSGARQFPAVLQKSLHRHAANLLKAKEHQ